uniref:Uncharacterized protein n=1 Tax=Arundo donax TaxID=35708 RepID=A0A0A9DVL1_ARUDO
MKQNLPILQEGTMWTFVSGCYRSNIGCRMDPRKLSNHHSHSKSCRNFEHAHQQKMVLLNLDKTRGQRHYCHGILKEFLHSFDLPLQTVFLLHKSQCRNVQIRHQQSYDPASPQTIATQCQKLDFLEQEILVLLGCPCYQEAYQSQVHAEFHLHSQGLFQKSG